MTPTDTTNRFDNIVFLSDLNDTDQIVDLFCGCGGSGSGIMDAQRRMGRNPHGTFVNHWSTGLEIHEANHPAHRHLREDLFLLKPDKVMPKGRRTSLLWGSPSCIQFSISRGNRPINEQGRSHADTIPQWVDHLRPEGIMIENVKEFLHWGPLRQRRDKKSNELCWAREVPGKKKGSTIIKPFPKLPKEHQRHGANHKRVTKRVETEDAWCLRMDELGYQRHLEPDPNFKGDYFHTWFKSITDRGYYGDWKLIRSCDHGDPTIRLRLFVQFVRKDTGMRVCWPYSRFAKPDKNGKCLSPRGDQLVTVQPWPTARLNVIDWTVKGESIFRKKKALAPATMRRIAIGLVKFGLKGLLKHPQASEFIVPKDNFGGDRVRSLDEPVSTLTVDHRGEGFAQPVVEPFSLTSNKGFANGLRGMDLPAATLTCNSRAEGFVDLRPTWLIPNFGERPTQTPRTHDVDSPIPAVTSHGAGGICEDQSFLLPKDQGFQKDYVVSLDGPVPAVQTTAVDSVIDARLCIIQNNGQSNAISIDSPLGAITSMQTQYVMQPIVMTPMINHLRGGNGVTSVDEPTRSLTAAGTHQLLTEAFLFLINNSGGGVAGRDGTYSQDSPARTVVTKYNQALVTTNTSFLITTDNAGKAADAADRSFSPDEPLRSVVTKANCTLAETFFMSFDQIGTAERSRRAVYATDEPMRTVTTKNSEALIKFTLEDFREAVVKVAPKGTDTSRVMLLLEPLMEELKKAGRADIKPWVYVYYGSGAVGADIDTPVPTVRTKEGTAICYPVLEFDGNMLLLDVLYRMLTVKELQRAQGFPAWTWCGKGLACPKPSPTSSRLAAADASSLAKPTEDVQEKLVGVNVRMDSERGVLELRSVVKSKGSAKTVERLTSYPLPTEHVDSVRQLAAMLRNQDQVARAGSEDTIGQSPIDSTSPKSGSPCERASLRVTGSAAAAERSIQLTLERDAGWSTTSGGGKHSQRIDAILTTLCSYAADVMASSIPAEMWTESSCAWTLELDHSFVWPKGISKSDIVKAIGNSVSRGLAEALTLAFYSQNENIDHFFN